MLTTNGEFDSLLTVLATAAAAAFVLATSAVGLGASDDVVAVSYAAIAAASAVFCASALDAPGEVVDFLASADIAEVEVEIGGLSFAGDVSVELFLTASTIGLGASVDAGGDGDSGGALVGAAAAVEASGSFPDSAFFSAFSGFSPISVPALPVAGFTAVSTGGATLCFSVVSFTAGAALASALVAASAPAARSVEVELETELDIEPEVDKLESFSVATLSFSSSFSTLDSTLTTTSFPAAAAVSLTFSATTANFPLD